MKQRSRRSRSSRSSAAKSTPNYTRPATTPRPSSRNYNRATVYDVVKKLKVSQGIAHAPCGLHKARKRTALFLAGVKRPIQANPAVFMAELRKKVNKTPHKSIEPPKSSVKRNMASFSMDEVVKACSAFTRRLEAMIQAEGGHFE